jgi:hypothetical protein
MAIDWGALLQTLTSTAIVVAALGYVSKSLLDHLLSLKSERMMAEVKAELESRAAQELEELRQKHARDLAEARQQAERKHEEFKAALGVQLSQKERIREQILRWANPILGSVTTLESRLGNILDHGGHLALSPPDAQGGKAQTLDDWSISYDYFMPSTLFLFAQYFCWVRRLEEELSFELFASQEEKDGFFAAIGAVNRALGSFPPRYPGTGKDLQLFALQQRGIGEALMLRDNGSVRCMGYYDLVQKLGEPALGAQMAPLKRWLEGLQPGERRWHRLEAVRTALVNLKAECEKLLQVKKPSALDQDDQNRAGGGR